MPATLPPLARSADLIVEEVEDEVLIYDELTAKAHCLSAEAARVWRACDGHTGEEGLALELDLDVPVVIRALAELESKELLQPPAVLPGNDDGATRREFGLKAAKLGGAVAAGPMIYSIVAPTALASATTPEIVCNYYSGKSCDACQQICGCCCCCQGCSVATDSPSCKMCSSINTCPAHTQGCADQLQTLATLSGVTWSGKACSSGPKCSATAKPPCSDPCIPNPGNGLCPDGINSGPFCPNLDCHTHDCNCFGVKGNPCCVNNSDDPNTVTCIG